MVRFKRDKSIGWKRFLPGVFRQIMGGGLGVLDSATRAMGRVLDVV